MLIDKQQPSQFSLEIYTITEALGTPELIQDLALYSDAHLDERSQETNSIPTNSSELAQSPQSLLFLRIWATADYFTLDEALMRSPPPVNVDISKSQSSAT